MIRIKEMYYDLGNAVKGICDKTYPRSRPKSVDDRPDSYIVVFFPSSVYNNEMDSSGGYNDYTTTAQIEIYVRDKVQAKNPNTFDVATADKKIRAVLERFPIVTDNITVTNPRLTLHTDDGDGFSVAIIQGDLRTR